MRFIPTILAILTVLCTGTPAIALQLDAAEHGIAGAAALPAEDESSAYQGGMSLDEAVEQVRRQYPGGKIVSAETRGKSHVIKVLTADGTVRTVRIPAR